MEIANKVKTAYYRESMGVLDKLFGSGSNSMQEDKKLPWIPLTDQEQLEGLQQNSYQKPQLVYKHSSTCGISSVVLNMFTKSYNLGKDRADLHFLHIQPNRQISDEIAIRYGVRHESPQLLIVKNGEVSFHTSHGAIAETDIEKYL